MELKITQETTCAMERKLFRKI